MDRLLSPNEAKFWLMDHAAPMNCVVVTRVRRPLDAAALVRGSAFALPTVVLGRHRRPRWSHRAGDRVPGVIEEVEGAESAWLEVAAGLLERPVGCGAHPNWRAVLIRHGAAGSTLALATNHALTDWRTCLLVTDAFLEGRFPGEIAPACEEMLPPAAYGDPDAAGLIDGWWSERAGARWEAAGLDRLSAALPPASPARFKVALFTAAETAALHARLAAEGVTLNGVVAAVLRDVLGVATVAHSVDMSRFIRPALPPVPGLAVSHLYTPVPPRATMPDVWETAREVRGALFERIQAGAHGDALLILPKVLLAGAIGLTAETADVTITGSPTWKSRDSQGATGDIAMQLVLSSARGGGDVVILSYAEGCLQLIAGCPETRPPGGRPPLDIAAVADRLRAAVAG